MKEVRLGKAHGEAYFGSAFDNWLDFDGTKKCYGAQGYANRVFEFFTLDKELREHIPDKAVIKFLRFDRPLKGRENVLDQFINEVKVLNFLQNYKSDDNNSLKWVTPMHAVGFYKFDQQFGSSATIEKEFFERKGQHYDLNKAWRFSLENLTGNLKLYFMDELDLFWKEFDKNYEDGYYPFIILEIKEKNNLQTFCEKKVLGEQRFNEYLPIVDVYEITQQICTIFEFLHTQKIFYNDNKPIHFYWDPTQRLVSMIDWNAAKFEDEMRQSNRKKDIKQFAIRTFYFLLYGVQHSESRHGANSIEDLKKQNQRYARLRLEAEDDERISENEICLIRYFNLSNTTFSALKSHVKRLKPERFN